MQQKATLHTSFWTQTWTCMATSIGFCDDLLHRMLTLILYGFCSSGFCPSGQTLTTQKVTFPIKDKREMYFIFYLLQQLAITKHVLFLCLFIHALCYIFAAVENDAPFPWHSF